MHSLGAEDLPLMANASQFFASKFVLELDVGPQFDDAHSLVRRTAIVIRRNSPNAEATGIDSRTESTGVTKVDTTCSRARLEVRMVKRIQHFGLQAEANIFSYRHRLADREIIVDVMRPVEINQLAYCSWRRVGSDELRVRPSARRAGQVLGIDKRHLGCGSAARILNVIDANRVLQL